jgi:lysophospholipase L1-like esterase
LKTIRLLFVFAALHTLTIVVTQGADAKPQLTWHDARNLPIEGKGWQDTKKFYDRLPARAEKRVRSSVWALSQNSAGMCVRFISDSDTISVRWVLRSDRLDMPHMPASGVSGIDLYARVDGQWRWTGNARPQQYPTNEVVIARSRERKQREYLLYLPLYNGVHSLEIGVSETSRFEGSPRRNEKPIVFYGTSILHGACASRPGMAYPAILGRQLERPVINLGFSGNAKSEPELAQLLAELDPVVYVLDPLPNMDAALVSERIEPFVRTLRASRPRTPIILVENIEYTDGHMVETRRERYTTANQALRDAYQRLLKSGEKRIYYIESKDLLGRDGEGTVDGTHPNDLGFMRMAEEIGPTLKKALKSVK